MASVSMKKYLKRYLSSDNNDLKKKKSKKKDQQLKQSANKLIDDDIDLKMIKGGFQDIEDLELGEDAPQIANIVDERPLHVQAEERFNSDKWRAIGLEENSSSELPIIKQKSKSRSPRRDSNSDPDQSPSRPNEEVNVDSDQSPPRHSDSKLVLDKSRVKNESQTVKIESSRHDSDSDQSPTRIQADNDGDLSPPRTRRRNDSETSDRKPEVKHKPKTLDGKTAGLSSGKSVRKETEELKRLTDEHFDQMDPEISGKGAKTNVRNKHKILEKARRLKEKKEREKEREEKYAKWGKGLKQQEMTIEKMKEDLHEMSKPLARYRDDADLDEHLRNQERDGDPMLEFLKKKRKNNDEEKPKFKGPMSPNRFNIPPGFRWDGVDRSSGFELQRFARLAKRKVDSEDTYKWSVEEM